MDAVHLIQRLNQHRVWVNDNLLTASLPLSEEQLHRTFQMGQGSIWKSLVHLYAAEYVWLEALLGNDSALLDGDVPGKIPGNQLGEGKIAGLDELRQKWSALDQRWLAYLSTLMPESLDEVVFKISYLGQRFGSRRSDVLMHVCTHAQYTSAQIVNMLRQTGMEKLPQTMLIALRDWKQRDHVAQPLRGWSPVNDITNYRMTPKE